jgi:two-component sensor histidine kinase/HAMP domain-containing protein
MWFFRNFSIKTKSRMLVLIPLGLALLILIIIFAIYQKISYTNDLLHNLRVLTEIIAENSTASLSFNNQTDAEKFLTALKAEKNILSACIYDRSGSVFAVYKKPGAPLSLPIYAKNSDHLFKNKKLMVYRNIILNNEIIGQIYIDASMAGLYARLRQIILFAFIFFVFLYALLNVFSLKLNRSILRPILHLATIAREISVKNDYAVRAIKYSKDELGLLTDSFNMMLGQIQSSDRALQNTHSELKKRAQELQRELTERMLAELQLKKSLREKDVLLKEIHHRVKNNLQIISSLIYLQSRQVKDPHVLQMFQDSQNRVRSMALIHEKLYNSKDLTRIDFVEYVRSLVSHLFNSYHLVLSKIKLKIEVKNLSLNIDAAIYCGLIINELVSNSLKYAFLENQSGVITIELDQQGLQEYVLCVRDNGVGLPENLSLQNLNSLGLQLVNNLTEQLNGKIEYFNDGGALFRILFRQNLNELK